MFNVPWGSGDESCQPDVQKDPHGGACDMQDHGIGVFNWNSFLEIVYAPVSDKPRTLMLDFFRLQIELGQNVDRSMRMLDLMGKLYEMKIDLLIVRLLR